MVFHFIDITAADNRSYPGLPHRSYSPGNLSNICQFVFVGILRGMVCTLIYMDCQREGHYSKQE